MAHKLVDSYGCRYHRTGIYNVSEFVAITRGENPENHQCTCKTYTGSEDSCSRKSWSEDHSRKLCAALGGDCVKK